MKKSLNIRINFTDKATYTLITAVFILIIGVSVFAFGTSIPSDIGHSAGELDLSTGVSGNAIFNGNVGIGTSNPQEKLHVVGNGLFNGNVSASNIRNTQCPTNQFVSGFDSNGNIICALFLLLKNNLKII